MTRHARSSLLLTGRGLAFLGYCAGFNYGNFRRTRAASYVPRVMKMPHYVGIRVNVGRKPITNMVTVHNREATSDKY